MSDSKPAAPFKMFVIEANRRGGHFSNTRSWAFEIKTGPRCSGMVSKRTYTNTNKAFEAGERMLNKLNGAR